MKPSRSFSNLQAFSLAALAVLTSLLIILKMLTFSPAVEAELARLETWFAVRVRVWFALCKLLLGLDMVIVNGRRSPAQQHTLHLQNPKNPDYDPNGHNSHVEGVAVDVNAWKGGRAVLLKNSSPAEWSAAVQLAQLCGLRWGGLFTGYYDGNHFDGY